MNTTQRKFALNRIHGILINKLEKLKVEDKHMLTVCKRVLVIPLPEMLQGIKAGTIKPYSQAKLKDLSVGSAIDHVYDLSPLIAKYKAKNNDLESPIDKNKQLTVYLQNPLDKKDGWGTPQIQPSFQSILLRAMKIERTLKNAADKIMLGNNTEALDAIKDIEAKVF